MDEFSPPRESEAWAINLARRLEGPLNKRLFCGILSRECRLFFDYDAFLVCFYDDTIKRLVPIYGEDTAEGEIEPVECVLDELVMGEVHPHPRLTNREKVDLHVSLVPFGVETRQSMSLLYCPIYQRDHIVGTLSVQSYTPYKYSEYDLDLLEEIANQCGDTLVDVRSEEQRLLLSQAVEQSASMIMITDDQGRIKFTNKRFQDLTGFTIDDVWGKGPGLFDGGQMPSAEHEALWERIRAGKAWRGEFYNRKKDGTGYWASANISPIFDSDGTVTHFLSVQEDITEAKRIAAERAWSERVLRAVSSAAGDFLMSSDWEKPARDFLARLGEATGGDRVFVAKWQSGEAVCNLVRCFEWRREGIDSREDEPLFRTPETAATADQGLKSYLQIPIPVSQRSWGMLGLEICRHDQVWTEGEVDTLRIAANAVGAAIQRSDMERALAESEEVNRTLVNSVPMNCFLLDPSGAILAMNQLACKSLDAPVAELIGKSVLEFGPEIDRPPRRERLERVRKGKKPVVFEDEFDGRVYKNWVHPVLDEQGHVARMAVFSTDITDMRQIDRLALLGGSVSSLGHSMKNIQTTMNGARAVMEKGLAGDNLELVETVWPVLDRSAKKFDQLIQNMLSLVREHDRVYSEEALNELVSEVAGDMAAAFTAAGIDLSVQLAEQDLVVSVSRTGIQEAVVNLLVNALEALTADGASNPRVTLATSVDEQANAIISVTDNGPGISDSLDQLFQPFFTTKGPAGTGIGLPVVKRVMAEHEGRVDIKTPPGGGASFVLTIPLTRTYHESTSQNPFSLETSD